MDWPGLRAAAVAIGIRKAARQAARDLPPDEQRAIHSTCDEALLASEVVVKSQQDKADAVVMSASALSANVRKGADVLSETLAEDSRETRLGLSGAARKAAETFAKMPGSKVIKHAQAHRHVTASASVLHGWDAQQDNGANVIVNIALLDIPPSEISAE
jgi:riboflavin synthase